MEIWHGLEQVPANLDASVVTIGVFDGIHRGHRKLIGAAKDRARELGIPCVLMTFDPHPLAVVAPDHMPPMLGSVAVRADLAEDLGVDYMLAVRFTPELAAANPRGVFYFSDHAAPACPRCDGGGRILRLGTVPLATRIRCVNWGRSMA